jgi:hypothetical protein
MHVACMIYLFPFTMFDAGNEEHVSEEVEQQEFEEARQVSMTIFFTHATLINFIYFCTCFNIVNPKDSLSLVKHSLYLGFYIGSCSILNYSNLQITS